ncbi:MAG: hypothetical protein EOS07_22010 [Mesorhizobium sp.]|nr:MAG: hypothetical protein EOS07_22010 [Mesorhizobium sp.]
MTVHYLIAGSRAEAKSTAIVDWGWHPDRLCGRDGYRRPNGDFVIPVVDIQYLVGIRPPSEIYLGYAWSAVRHIDAALRELRACGCTVHHP